jgi:hypothetical protein
VRWCSDLNQRRGGGLPETAFHGGARRAEALDGDRSNEGWGTSLSRSMRSSCVWRWSQEVLVGPDGELERAIAGGVHNDLEWTGSEQRRGAEQLR